MVRAALVPIDVPTSRFWRKVSMTADPLKRAVAVLPKWRLMRVVKYIDTNIGEAITLPNLAATAGLSRMHFARQFRARTGVRPHDFVLHKRIEHAQRKLAATSDALVDIALSVGFRTQAHFTTVFKKVAGNTPCKWRREQPVINSWRVSAPTISTSAPTEGVAKRRESAYPFFEYEEHQPFADTDLPAKMGQGPEEEPAAP